jgi:Protein of unknown function (DUF2934)
MSISISSHQQIRHRAHEIFQERKQTGRKGDALSDWLEAEQDVRSRRIPVQSTMPRPHPTPTIRFNARGFRPHPPPTRPSTGAIREPAFA